MERTPAKEDKIVADDSDGKISTEDLNVQILAAFYNVKNRIEQPRLLLGRKMIQYANQSRSCDRSSPKCRRNLFGPDEASYVDPNGNEVPYQVWRLPAVESVDEEFTSTEKEADKNTCLHRVKQIQQTSVICLSLMYKAYFHGEYSLTAEDNDSSFSDEKSCTDDDNSDDKHDTSDESYFDDDIKLVSDGECGRKNITMKVYFSPSHKLKMFDSDVLNISRSDIRNASSNRNLFEGHSEAKYDHPRLLPEHYVAPTRQPRLPFRQRSINTSPRIMRGLSFDNDHSEETTEGLHSVFTKAKEMLLQTPTSVPKSSRRPVKRRLFDDIDSSTDDDRYIYELSQTSNQATESYCDLPCNRFIYNDAVSGLSCHANIQNDDSPIEKSHNNFSNQHNHNESSKETTHKILSSQRESRVEKTHNNVSNHSESFRETVDINFHSQSSHKFSRETSHIALVRENSYTFLQSIQPLQLVQ